MMDWVFLKSNIVAMATNPHPNHDNNQVKHPRERWCEGGHSKSCSGLSPSKPKAMMVGKNPALFYRSLKGPPAWPSLLHNFKTSNVRRIVRSKSLPRYSKEWNRLHIRQISFFAYFPPRSAASKSGLAQCCAFFLGKSGELSLIFHLFSVHLHSIRIFVLFKQGEKDTGFATRSSGKAVLLQKVIGILCEVLKGGKLNLAR